MKLHLGCGKDIRKDWINIDLPYLGYEFSDWSGPNKHLFYHDLSKGLPKNLNLSEGSVEMVYSAHFLEHLMLKESLNLLKECFHVLKPGGLLRLCLPNFRAIVEAYINNDKNYFDYLITNHLGPLGKVKKDTPLIEIVSDAAYQYSGNLNEHRDLWDIEKALWVLKNLVNFPVVREVDFNPELDVNDDLRKKYSFYIEAIK